MMFPAPLELLQRKWMYGWSRTRTVTGFPRLGMLAVFWFLLLVFMPLSFALLPQTRRKSKVRWAHIIRIGLYAAAFTTPLLWWVAIWQVPHFGVLGMLGMCGITLVWWGAACSSYLRIPRPWFVASMLTFMLLLLGSTALFYMFPNLFVTQMVSW